MALTNWRGWRCRPHIAGGVQFSTIVAWRHEPSMVCGNVVSCSTAGVVRVSAAIYRRTAIVSVSRLGAVAQDGAAQRQGGFFGCLKRHHMTCTAVRRAGLTRLPVPARRATFYLAIYLLPLLLLPAFSLLLAFACARTPPAPLSSPVRQQSLRGVSRTTHYLLCWKWDARQPFCGHAYAYRTCHTSCSALHSPTRTFLFFFTCPLSICAARCGIRHGRGTLGGWTSPG